MKGQQRARRCADERRLPGTPALRTAFSLFRYQVAPNGKELLKNINLGMYLGAKIGILGEGPLGFVRVQVVRAAHGGARMRALFSARTRVHDVGFGVSCQGLDPPAFPGKEGRSAW